jgi:WD40 repeat protein/transcriptional regulator with XRE-family HTH domain
MSGWENESTRPMSDRVRNRQDFANELTLLRTYAGLSVRELSTRIGEPHSTIGQWFAGRSVPSTSSLALFIKVLRACGVDTDEAIAAWVQAWQTVQRAPGRRSGPEPYRGLASFQPQDAEWFFGREVLTERVAAKITEFHAAGGGLQIVVGASGSGKSSLIRAGVIPALTSQSAPGRRSWPLVLLTPGTHPLDELALALSDMSGDSGVDDMVASIRSDPVEGIVRATRAAAGKSDRLLIVVDQFEELFTLCPDEKERQAFVTALVAAVGSPAAAEDRQPPVATVVLIGLRADFYPHALAHPELARTLQEAQFVVGPLSEPELRRAIVEPANKANLDITDGLVELLLRDVSPPAGQRRDDPSQVGALPLLSHALLATWEGRQSGQMTVDAYLSTGGIEGAVARTADAAYGELSPAEQVIARRLFLRLVNLGEDTADTRRRVRRADLESSGQGEQDPQRRQVIEQFVGRRLLIADSDTIEISHEALLAAWPRLRAWIESDRDGLRIQRQLADAAREWHDLHRDPESLYRGGRLEAAREWSLRGDSDSELALLEREFLAASIEQDQAEKLVARRRTHRLQRMVAALTALFVISGALAGYSYWKRDTTNRERDRAFSRQVAGTADRLRATDPGMASMLAMSAYRIAPTEQARSSLLTSTGAPLPTRIVRASKGPQNVVLTPDGRTLIGVGAGPSDTSVLIWDLTDPRNPRALGTPLTDHTKPIFGLAVSPNGRMLATGGMDRTVRLWNIADPSHPRSLGVLPGGPSDTVYSLAFSPDGKSLAAGSADRTIRLWDVADPLDVKPLGLPLTGAAGYVQSVAFSPDGTVMAAGDAAGSLQLWTMADVRNPQLVGRLRTGDVQINTVAFAPDGKSLALGGAKGLLQFWDVSKPSAAKVIKSTINVPDNWVNSLSYSPDGGLLAVGSSDNVAQIWERSTGRLVSSLPQTEPVSTVSFLRDDRTLVTSGSDGVARLWAVPGPVITGATATVTTTMFSPDGRSIAAVGGTVLQSDVTDPRMPVALFAGLRSPPGVAPISGAGAMSPDGKVLVAGTFGTSVLAWDVADRKKPVSLGAPLTGPTALVESLAFSADGRLLAAGDDAGKVHLWDLTDPRRPRASPVVLDAENIVYTVAFSPKRQTLAAVTVDGMIRLWDLTDPYRPTSLAVIKGSADLLFAAAFSMDGELLATGSADGVVQLWDLTKSDGVKPLGGPLTGPDGTVPSVAFAPDGRTLAATTRTGQVWLWNVERPLHPQAVAVLTASGTAVWALGFSPDGHTIATGGSDRTVRIWETDPGRAATMICGVGGDRITPEDWQKYVPGVPYRSAC